ncbi:MAG: 1-deoxy-D-xylulose-5-phosphate reductoisomerase [Peptococcaceae bacterium]|nr:1-deoxy-D-xylulose-5-phosphate reductoisomerase [Peptococcaceae bacterium]
MKKRIAVVGSTGSIGRQTLEVAAAQPEALEVVALAAGSNSRVLADQVRQVKPGVAVLWEEEPAGELREALRDLRVGTGDCPVRVSSGMPGLLEMVTASDVDTVVMAVSGCIGLEPTLAALQAGKQVALANKETLVAGGELVMAWARLRPGSLVPVDSEHSAIWQCLSEDTRDVTGLVLTASGGPFRTWDENRLAAAKPADALRHPNWQMGPKITIDSATLMNKGLEVIEAHHLFDMPYETIDVLVHPQSVVHSMVVYSDGAVIAQMGIPDMRLPIQYALSYPRRWPCSPTPVLAGQGLTFEKVNEARFPALGLAYDCGRRGGLMPAVMNAANEVCVQAFLREEIAYPRIYEVVKDICGRFDHKEALSLANVLAADAWARREAENVCRIGWNISCDEGGGCR